MSEQTKIHVTFHGDEGFAGENLWATPVGVDAADLAKFKVDNIPFFAYDISYADVVTCQRDGDGIWEVTGVAERSGWATLRVMCGESFSFESADDSVVALMDRLRDDFDCKLERAQGPLFSLAVPEGRMDDVTDLLEAHYVDDLDAEPDGLMYEVACTPDDPAGPLPGGAQVSTEPSPGTGTAWRADEDPYFADMPTEVREVVQSYADHHELVARAVETGGMQGRVLEFIDRLQRFARGEQVEPLDGPFFDFGDES